jgi:DNA-binding FadR family transcriptional regulator
MRRSSDAGTEGLTPPCERLVAALADDFIEGRLEAGARLPAHRDLAWQARSAVAIDLSALLAERGGRRDLCP